MPKLTKKRRDVDIEGAVFGHIPGIKVGKWWATRKECAADHVHPPWIAGIYGRKDDGARSVVLSGDSEFADDDQGENFTYIGSGGRAPGVRFGPQTENQTAENSRNAALIRSALLKRPVRVVRGAGHSKFAPNSGYRYDGLYVVSKPRIEPGPSGFLVYKFDFKRLPDQDPLPTGQGPSLPIDKSDAAARRRQYRTSLHQPRPRTDRAKSAGSSSSGSRRSPVDIASDEDDWDEDDLEGLFTSIDEVEAELNPVRTQLEDLSRRDQDLMPQRKSLLIVIGDRIEQVLARKREEQGDIKYWRRQLWAFVSTKLPTDKHMKPEHLEDIYRRYKRKSLRKLADS